MKNNIEDILASTIEGHGIQSVKKICRIFRTKEKQMKEE